MLNSRSMCIGLWIMGYFASNILLTIHNKFILSSLNFKFPWFLTAIHLTVSGIGAFIIQKSTIGHCVEEKCTNKRPTFWHFIIILGYSIVYTLNIALSNIGLIYASLSFHQLSRGAGPVFTVMIEKLLGKKLPFNRLPPLILVVIGVTLSSFHEVISYDLENREDIKGVIICIMSVMLSSIKNIITNRILNGEMHISPLDLMQKMMLPCVSQCLFVSYFVGETSLISNLFGKNFEYRKGYALNICMNSIFAMILNCFNFSTSSRTSALTMAIIGNMKQIVLVVSALIIFDKKISVFNSIGIAMAIAGGVWFSLNGFKKRVESSAGSKI